MAAGISLMGKTPADYIERCYAGWLGKLIGVRFGAPIEGWTYERIRKVYGVLDGYIDAYPEHFAADDDTNVPLALLSALYDYTHTSDITPEQIGLTLMNYAPYEHGFFWWGGYGKSTEHTAYTNLREGIKAPWSGSVEHNGAAVAEQIGGQIFIDPWGLIAPGDPALAAEYAAKAASVTHGGNGIYGGMFVAAAIAAAFVEKDIRDVINKGLSVIPTDSEYKRMADDIIGFYDSDAAGDWVTAFTYIQEHWGYDLYPGVCHIIPNSAVMIMSMLYGKGDFTKTLCICNMCGWDTDCNVGNVGAIMGTMAGINGIEMRWRARVNDAFALSTLIGSRNYLDAPWCTAYIAALGYKIAGEAVPSQWAPFLKTSEFHCHFEFPGSTHGFKAYRPESGAFEANLAQTNEESASGKGSLKIAVGRINGVESFRVARRTHFRPADFHDSRYDPSFSPLVYPGQTLSVQVKAGSKGIKAALYALDANSGRILTGEEIPSSEEHWTELTYKIPAGSGICVDEVGISIYAETGRHSDILVYVDDLTAKGFADYTIDFNKERNELWSDHHREVSQFTYLRGIWHIERGRLIGTGAAFAETYTGRVEWGDIDFTAVVYPLFMETTQARAGISFRAQGAMRSYSASLSGGKLSLLKNING
ncbi:MAG: ADP-ribosylglycohydrolase family protein, partial [Clostridiales bacterium]|nr:ADP-ribosylglycohydrolase family protein [Clostridiales bacterium]